VSDFVISVLGIFLAWMATDALALELFQRRPMGWRAGLFVALAWTAGRTAYNRFKASAPR